ncbi:iron-siderophore ABC transporter substrate-binding protein [Brevibacterium litoralis]|uniref:iron-siderophore ABC transporter substrate-binding protein n=1 Tax=Brevibacterium litoralis TaxID=3138935 RepID=UPI0032EE6891
MTMRPRSIAGIHRRGTTGRDTTRAGLTRRSLGLGAAAAALSFGLVACGSGTTEAGTEGAGEDDGQGASGAAFPVEIESALGTATIEEKPERVVTIGQGSAETAIALGTVPVGIEAYPWGADPESGYLPWIEEEVTASGGALPEQWGGDGTIDTEAIIALDPDVVLAPWSGITQEEYDALSAYAPVVAYPEQPWTIEWQDQIEIIGQALGESEAAAEAITGVEETLASAAKPEYEGLTYSFVYTNGPGTLGAFYPEEQRSATVAAMGLTPDPVIEDMRSQFDAPGTMSALVGLENADMLADSDLLFTFYTDEESRKEIEGQDLYASIPAVERGSVVAPTDPSLVTASSIINPLTVEWMLDEYQVLIDEAVAKL